MAVAKQPEVVPPPPLPAANQQQTEVQTKASRKKWVLLTSLFIIFITVDTVVFLTLDRIFFGVRTPEYRLESLTVHNLRLTPRPPSFNVQLNGQVTLMNRNLFGTITKLIYYLYFKIIINLF